MGPIQARRKSRRTSFINRLVVLASIAVVGAIVQQATVRRYRASGLPARYHRWHTRHFGMQELRRENLESTVESAREGYRAAKARRLHAR